MKAITYVTGSAKRYTNAHTMIFLYKRCYSKTHNIFYSIFFGPEVSTTFPTLTPNLRN